MPKSSSNDWTAISAWGDAISPGRYGRLNTLKPIRMEFPGNVGLSTIIVEDGQDDRLAIFVRDHWGLELPPAGQAAFRGRSGLVWAGPGQWLAVAAVPEDLDGLPVELAGVAAVTDHGDGRAVVYLSGEAARRMLQKGMAIDLDASAFKKGHTAVAALTHLGVQIWQTADDPVYVLAVGRSVARTIAEWLKTSAAEYGYEVVIS